MHTQSPHRVRAPYGLAFPVHELVFVRAWAQHRRLAMAILLDQVLDGAEFEEMLVMRGAARDRRALTLWRVEGGMVVAQVENRAPRVFSGIHSALSQLGEEFPVEPGRVRSAWRRRWGRGRF